MMAERGTSRPSRVSSTKITGVATTAVRASAAISSKQPYDQRPV
jgi:hypothetical protein